ncbi:MAG: ATP-binding protein [Nitrospirae bacterium]|nr:ATP-binding protein [Nitrospirota bacterium]
MRIKEFEYHDKTRGWKLERTKFSDLTLLVGISGVGKTEILRAIDTVKNIAEGGSFSGVEWDIDFSTNDGNEYRWMGAFEKQNDYSEDGFTDRFRKRRFSLIYERLYRKWEIIVERDDEKILFKGKETPKLLPDVSTIHTLKEEDDISPAYNSLKMIYVHNKVIRREIISDKLLKSLQNYHYSKLEEIRNYEIPIIIKFLLVSEFFKETFEEIKEHFTDLFSNVENIRIKLKQLKDDFVIFSFQIKERGIDNWIPVDRISSGMLKTLYLICEMYLQPEGTVSLIDEFENGLGINCISILGESLSSERKTQYIITSHHPYIINNVGRKHWKVVNRKGGVVTTHDADELLNVKSHHEAFIRLMNLPEYKDGIVGG